MWILLIFATIPGWISCHDDIKVVGAVNNSVTLACDVTRDTAKDDVITWTDTVYMTEREKPKLIFTNKDNGNFQPYSNHVNHASYQIDRNTYALTINNIKTDDVGTYICRNERTHANISYYLNVYERLKCEGWTDLGEGEKTSVRCNTRYSGDLLKLVWYKEGQRLESNDLYKTSEAGGLLAKIEAVLTVQPADDGKELRCEMNFAGKTDRCSLKLNVSYGLREPSLEPNASSYHIGQKIRCQSMGNPTPMVKVKAENISKLWEGPGYQDFVVPVEWVSHNVTLECIAKQSYKRNDREIKKTFIFPVTENPEAASSLGKKFAKIDCVLKILTLLTFLLSV